MTTYRASFHGTVIAESDQTIVVEGNRYFPPTSLTPGTLTRSWMKSLCYWKGVASYFDVAAGSDTQRHVAWTYRHPTPFARRIKNHVAFWPGSVLVEPAPGAGESAAR